MKYYIFFPSFLEINVETEFALEVWTNNFLFSENFKI